MDSSKLKVIIIVALAALFAVYLGIAAATAQLEAIGWIVGIAGLVAILAMGNRVWVLIPISMGLSGSINALPGSPPAWAGAMLVAWVMTVLRFVMRTNELRYRPTWLDFGILIQAIAVGQAWLRNPTGLLLLGGDIAGGKGYFLYAFAIGSYVLLSLIKTNLRTFKIVIILTLVVSILDGLLVTVSQLVPSIAFAVMPLYSAVAYEGNTVFDAQVSRLVSAKMLGQTLGVAALTMFPPISLVNPLKIGRFLMFSTACVLVLMSGFRSVIGMFAILFTVASFVRGRKQDVLIAAALSCVMLSLLAVSGQARHLPFGVQRILSVLPIEVDDKVRLNAEDSNDFRFEMWKLALSSDRYIKNKLLGDGFGFDASAQRAVDDARGGDARRAQGLDIMMETGSYHGFHVETIRVTGIVGLLAALVGMGIFFRTAWKLIQYYKGRPEWMYVLYVCIPFLIHPFYYMLIYGSYKSEFCLLFIGVGMLKILDNIRRNETV